MTKSTTPKETTVAVKEAVDLNQIDLTKIDLVALKHLADRAQAAFQERKVGELKTLVNGWIMKAEAVGYTIQDCIEEFRSRLPAPAAPVRRGPRGPRKTNTDTAAKTFADADSTGARPEPGKTYVINGESWTKNPTGRGATKKTFLDAVRGGALWSEMLQR